MFQLLKFRQGANKILLEEKKIDIIDNGIQKEKLNTTKGNGKLKTKETILHQG